MASGASDGGEAHVESGVLSCVLGRLGLWCGAGRRQSRCSTNGSVGSECFPTTELGDTSPE